MTNSSLSSVTKKLRKICIMAGGTGGHVFPGLTIAEALLQHNISICWLGTPQGIEARLVPAANIPFFTLNIKGFRGKSWHTKLSIPFQLLKSVTQAYQFLKNEKPDVVISMGGFAAAPGGLAAKLLSIPLIIHEQNSIAGLTNRLLSHLAQRVLCAFPKTFPPQKKLIITGNPVREGISTINPPEIRLSNRTSKPKLLILGGSLGAQALNEMLPEAIAQLPLLQRPEIWHQTGQKHYEKTCDNYAVHSVKAKVVPFIDDMAAAYEWADLVICRAGALTLAEITSVGVASILIPYPHAVDDHQTANARYLEETGAALLLPQVSLTAVKLSQHLAKLLNSAEQRFTMAQAARQLRQENAIQAIIQQCFEVSVSNYE